MKIFHTRLDVRVVSNMVQHPVNTQARTKDDSPWKNIGRKLKNAGSKSHGFYFTAISKKTYILQKLNK